MALIAKFKKISEMAVDLGIIMIEDVIESLSTEDSRASLQNRLRENAERASQLALNVARLEDENLSLKTSNSVISPRESDMLQSVIKFINSFSETEELTDQLIAFYNRFDVGLDEECGHFNPPNGYDYCTREWPHDGPCALPFVGE
jgi:hypothetical protein